MFKQTIKTNIFTIFLILVAIISSSILASQYYFNKKLALSSAEQTFTQIATVTENYLEKKTSSIRNILISNIDNDDLKQEITFNIKHPALHNLIQMMKITPEIYAMYFAHNNKSFYEVVNMHNSKILYDIYKAPKKARWTVIISINNKTQYAYFDKNINFLSKYSVNKKYNPLNRPWYKRAIKADKTITTKPYLFSNLQKYGMTFATKIDREGSVFALDYTMKNISELLSAQKADKNLELFIFNEKGKVLASSNKKSKLIDSDIMKTFDKSNMQKIILYKKDSNQYFTIYKHLKHEDGYLGITLNTDELFKPFIDNIKYSLSISLLFLLLSIPLILYATNIIVRPIKALITENEKIKNRQFDKVKNIDSNIIELTELSNSLVLMSKSIKEYQISQEKLLDSIVKLIAEAVDAKSAYTGGHCKRVPEIAQMLVKEASISKDGVFKEFNLSTKDELREFEIGAWLHDCGKVTTPEYVVDKSTKLETINDRIHEVRTRFEVLWRDAQIEYLRAQLDGEEREISLKNLKLRQEKLTDDFSFIANTNIGGEFMDEEKQKRVKEIAEQEWKRNFDDSLGLGEIEILRYDHTASKELPAKEKLLSDKKQHIIKRENFNYEAYERDGFKGSVPKDLYNYGEVYNLCIEKGTLSPEERYKINEHVILSIKMLEKIPFPSHMTKIPEYAGTHHETLIGTGYPRQLTASELSIPARIMALADVFEALTASDRPYKKAKTLSTSIKIMSFMVKDQHLDGDIFKLFLKSGLYKTYAQKYLKSEQIDEVDEKRYL